MRWLALVALVSGCASPKEPRYLSGEGITVETGNGTSVTVPGGVFDLTFSNKGMQMPSAIHYQGVEVISMNDGSMDPETEHGVGLGLYPAYNVVAPGFQGVDPTDDRYTNQLSSVETDMVGPVASRHHVHWSFDFQCPDPHHAEGTSTFTIYPTGYIERFDQFSPTSLGVRPPQTATIPCGHRDELASDFNTFFLTSFWVFTAKNDLYDDDTPVDPLMDNDGHARACAQWDSHRIVAVDENSSRLWENNVNSFVFDWKNGVPTIAPGMVEHSSRLQFADSATCSGAFAKLDRPPLYVDGDPVTFSKEGWFFAPETKNGTFTLESRDREMPGGFVVSLDLDGAEHLTVDRDGEDVEFLAQIVPPMGTDPERVLLLFEEPLASDATLTIDVF